MNANKQTHILQLGKLGKYITVFIKLKMNVCIIGDQKRHKFAR